MRGKCSMCVIAGTVNINGNILRVRIPRNLRLCVQHTLTPAQPVSFSGRPGVQPGIHATIAKTFVPRCSPLHSHPANPKCRQMLSRLTKCMLRGQSLVRKGATSTLNQHIVKKKENDRKPPQVGIPPTTSAAANCASPHHCVQLFRREPMTS